MGVAGADAAVDWEGGLGVWAAWAAGGGAARGEEALEGVGLDVEAGPATGVWEAAVRVGAEAAAGGETAGAARGAVAAEACEGAAPSKDDAATGMPGSVWRACNAKLPTGRQPAAAAGMRGGAAGIHKEQAALSHYRC